MLRALGLTALLTLTACASLTQVARRESTQSREAEYPTLAPLPELLAQAEAPARVVQAETTLGARASGLRARAEALRQRD